MINLDFLQDLNEGQQRAVEYNDGASLVIAGAGSGKTRVLTYKIAYLLTQGMRPWEILALTFTNKAAREMKERIGKLVGTELSQQLHMGTFHSVFSRILRAEAAQLGYDSNFTIYDETDSRSLLKSIIKTMNLDEKTYKPSTVHNRISMAKNHLITAEAYAQDRSLTMRDQEARIPAVYQVYLAYQARLQQANAMDFDDLLLNTFILFHEHEDIRQKYAQRFHYVLVDEYQDTNYAQQAIVLQLVKEHQHVCVVGDDAQSIYAFRGANIDNILDFQQKFNDTKLFKLEQNYRSTQRIVQAANSLIRHNQRQIEKDVFSKNDEGEKLIYKPAYSDREEAMIVCNDIKRIRRQDHCEYSDFAILYRTNAQSRTFEEEMRKQGIPYRIYGGLSFYQRKEIKDIIAYFRLVANPNDEEAFRRILNYPARGIGNTTLQKIMECSARAGVSLWTVICDPVSYGLDVNKGTMTKIDAFRMLISSFVVQMTSVDAYELGQTIIKESGVSADIYSSTEPDAVSRQENLQEFMSGMQDFVESRREEGREQEIFLTDFLQEVALLTDLDSDDNETSRVTLMTIHSAKGLEFPTVFIVGLEENLFPSPLSVNSLRELEEERRLLYVAITRAEKHCILTNAKSRFRYGKMEFGTPSRFLKDIDPSLMLIEDNGAGISSQKSFTGNSSSQKSFTGYRSWGDDWRSSGSSRMQNSRPVASQFRADPKPKITAPSRPEPAVDPFSERFKQRLAQSGGNLRRINDVMTKGRTQPNTQHPTPITQQEGTKASPSGARSEGALSVGSIIEHQRFGIGTVLRIEGTGENTKATVEFRNAGIKQLLLKFAKYKIIS
ncbi:MAG: UvrD-helicase domain-containing protein [Prevotella sp.]|nr:UvrD-helicase domain-containing protein [Prevotella sp.]